MKKVNNVLATPWKVSYEVRRILLRPLAMLYVRSKGVKWHPSWKVYGLPLIQRERGSVIEIGRGLSARSWYSTNPLGARRCVFTTRSSTAELIIGDDVGMTGTSICCESRITIGDHVRIGNLVTIVDTDFHPLNLHHRLVAPNDGRSKPITIEDHVFIGMSVMVLKGTHIGRGSVIGAGSVVTGTIPPNVIAAGNPAVVIKQLDNTIPT